MTETACAADSFAAVSTAVTPQGGEGVFIGCPCC